MKRLPYFILFLFYGLSVYGQPPGGFTGPSVQFYNNHSTVAVAHAFIDLDPCDGYYVVFGGGRTFDLLSTLQINDVPSKNFSSTVIATVNVYSGTVGSGTLLTTKKQKLFISAEATVMTQAQGISDLVIDQGASYATFQLSNWTVQGGEESSLSDLQFSFDVRTDFRYSYKFVPCLHTNQVVSGQNPVEFTWTNCCDAPNYEFQLLRLYNRDENSANPISSEQDAESEVDWSQALRLETGNGEKSLTLTVAEGTGWYVWRVRPIFDVKKNTIGDDRNWGVWTPHGPYTNGAILEPKNNGGSYTFYYNQFDDDKNWIFSRGFVEGEPNHGSQLRIGEGMTYGNGLGMVKQSQGKSQTNADVLGSQTVYDYNGRGVVQSLSAPLGQLGFSYKPKLLEGAGGVLYTAADIDEDLKYKNPNPVQGGKVLDYYSDANPDKTIPNAEGYPMSQAVYYNDALTRPKLQAGAGIHSAKGDASGVQRNNRIYYTRASDAELIRVFGDEAPKGNSIDKTMSVDANQTISVNYKDDAGRTIATCLSRPTAAKLLPVELPPAQQPSELEILDVITDSKPTIGGNGMYTHSARYMFAEPTQFRLKYVIDKKEFGNSCYNFCRTCDYYVQIVITDLEGNSTIYNHPFNPFSPDVVPTGCGIPDQYTWEVCVHGGGGAPILATTWTGPNSCTGFLDPGEYTVERKIKTGLVNSVTGNTYLQDATSALSTWLYNDLQSASFKVSHNGTFGSGLGNQTAVMTNVTNLLTAKNLSGLNDYLLSPGTDPIDATEMTWTFYDATTDCKEEIKVPVYICEEATCDADTDFSAYFLNEIAGEITSQSLTATDYIISGGTTSNIASYTQPTPKHPTTPTHSITSLNSATLTGVVQNMINESPSNNPDGVLAYQCEDIWASWKDITEDYIQKVDAVKLISPSTDWVDVLHNFIGPLGYQIQDFKSSPTDPDVVNYPYKYFAYTAGQCPSCEQSIACSPSYKDPLGGNGVFPVTNTSLHNWFAYLNTPISPATQITPIAQAEMNNFFLCVYSGCSPTSIIVSSGSGTNAGGILTAPGFLNNLNQVPSFQFQTSNNLSTTSGGGFSTTVATPPATIQDMKLYMENECNQNCDQMWQTYVDDITNEYAAKNIGITGQPCVGCTSTVDIKTVYCRAQAMIDECKSHCTLTITSIAASGGCPQSQQLGTAAEQSAYQTAMTSVADIQLPDPDPSGTCAAGYTKISNGSNNHASTIDAMLVNLNNAAASQVSVSQNTNQPTWDFCNLISPYDASITCPDASFTVSGLSQNTSDISFYIGTPTTYTQNIADPGINATVTTRVYSEMSQYMEAKVLVELKFNSAVTSNTSVSFIGTQTNANVVSGNASPAFQGPFSANQVITYSYVIDPTVTTGTISLGNQLLFGSNAPNVFPAMPINVQDCLDLYVDVVTGTPQNPPVINGPNPITYSTITSKIVDLSREPICITDANLLAGSCGDICYKWIESSDIDPIHDLTPLPCIDKKIDAYSNRIMDLQDNIVWRAIRDLRTDYNKNCGTIDDYMESAYVLNYVNYTLYYYDRAGNLVRTVPPEGVRYPSTMDRTTHPPHELVTEYEYNSLKQLIRQKTPDGGTTLFWYDAKGKLRFSQNAKQGLNNTYSYTKYDALSRIIEVGECNNFGAIAADPNIYANQATLPTSGTSQIVKTFYTTPIPNPITSSAYPAQRFLQNRVSYTYSDPDPTVGGDEAYSIYSYDPHGNVEWVEQRAAFAETNVSAVGVPDFARRIYYDYDLASGSVLKVKYAPEIIGERFFHKYTYDTDKRLLNVSTSTDNMHWTPEAKYEYYKHGPLKRVVLGKGVQGLDYVYTIEGWLKSINHASLHPGNDPGADDGVHTVAMDTWGMELNYYTNDFNRVGSPFNSNASNSYYINNGVTVGSDLYNGNIRSWLTHVDHSHVLANNPTLMTGLKYMGLTAYQYKYDELNRIKRGHFTWRNVGNTAWDLNGDGLYNEEFSYDLNGNIKSLVRNRDKDVTYPNPMGGLSGNSNMDDFTYSYITGTNRLDHVVDNYTQTTSPNVDDIRPGQTGGNYQYDAIGNLIEDKDEELGIEWNVYGKVKSVQKKYNNTPGPGDKLRFYYGAGGNRLGKYADVAAPPINQSAAIGSYYVRDASGNIMAVYDRSYKTINVGVGGTTVALTETRMRLAERPIYGSDRLGVLRGDNPTNMNQNGNSSTLSIGRFYELKDHLGNVRAVLGDTKLLLGGAANPIGAAGMGQNGSITTNGSYQHNVGGPNGGDELTGTVTAGHVLETVVNIGGGGFVPGQGYSLSFTSLVTGTGSSNNAAIAGDAVKWEISIHQPGGAQPDAVMLFTASDVQKLERLDFIAPSNNVDIYFKMLSAQNTLNSTGYSQAKVELANYQFERNRYIADLKSSNNYYAFGSPHPFRDMNAASGYRFGFQGQEKDNEIKGIGNSVNYKYRMHDSRLGRFFAVDPLASEYPHNSPYAFSENQVIDAVELEGLEKDLIVPEQRDKENVKTKAAVENADNVYRKVSNAVVEFLKGFGYNQGSAEAQEYIDAKKQAGSGKRSLAELQGSGGISAKYARMEFLATGGLGSRGRNTSGKGNTNRRGAVRAAQYSTQWGNASLTSTVRRIAPGSKGVRTSTGKMIYKNSETGLQVVADEAGNYFRIENTNLTGRRRYLDLDGNVPNNVLENGKMRGRNQGEYNQVTHFNNSD